MALFYLFFIYFPFFIKNILLLEAQFSTICLHFAASVCICPSFPLFACPKGFLLVLARSAPLNHRPKGDCLRSKLIATQLLRNCLRSKPSALLMLAKQATCLRKLHLRSKCARLCLACSRRLRKGFAFAALRSKAAHLLRKCLHLRSKCSHLRSKCCAEGANTTY